MKKLIVFDLDGVLFDSKQNMRKAWNDVKNELNINIPFNKYFEKIGKPFKNILKDLKIKEKNFSKAHKIFNTSSIKNLHLIKTYPNIKSIIRYLNNSGYTLAVLTSKDLNRTKILLKKFKLEFKFVQCPTKNGIGKPNPKILRLLKKKTNFQNKQIYYIGDTYLDYQFSKKAKINFIFSKFGYGKLNNKSVYKISNLKNLRKIF